MIATLERCDERLAQLVGRHFVEAEARAHWDEIVRIRARLSDALGRDVSLAVAAHAYFTSGPGPRLDLRLVEAGSLDRLRGLARTDALTGVLNRRGFIPVLDRELARARGADQPLSLLLVDVDRFKSVNDRHGHLWGDRVLARLARCLVDACRSIDSVARFGGDEFVVLLPGTEGDGARVVAERIRHGVEGTDLLAGCPSREPGERITVSIGVATGTNAEPLLVRSDEALYEAKRTGRARICAAREGRAERDEGMVRPREGR